MRIALLMLSVLFASACTRPVRSGVDVAMLLPPGAQTLDVPDDQVFLMATPLLDPLPDYPSELIADARDDVAVCVEIVVGEDGGVRAATPLYGLSACPLARERIDRRYVDAAVAAVRRWSFIGAAVCRFPPGVARDDDCRGDGVVVEPVAIRLAFVFAFRIEGGRAQVSVRRG